MVKEGLYRRSSAEKACCPPARNHRRITQVRTGRSIYLNCMRSAPLLGEVSRYPPLSWVGIEKMAYLVGEYAKHAVPLFKNTIERAEYDKGASCNYS